jgi:hypothetical protein
MAEAAGGGKEAARAVVESDEQSATLKLAQATISDGGNGAGAEAAALDGSQAGAEGEGGMSKRQLKKAAKGLLKDKKDKKPP